MVRRIKCFPSIKYNNDRYECRTSLIDIICSTMTYSVSRTVHINYNNIDFTIKFRVKKSKQNNIRHIVVSIRFVRKIRYFSNDTAKLSDVYSIRTNIAGAAIYNIIS